MRSGGSTVQQTLTPESAAVLKHAVADACRRGHAQATPLHVAAVLLRAPTCSLRKACMQSHPQSPHPLQCRALELCFSVALDRLQAAQGPVPDGQPAYSNALTAALKRAQAHQRRGCPEQQQQPLLAVKVELEHLVISILDDPGVSRVMREAGFSSPDVKNHLEEFVNLVNARRSLPASRNFDHAQLAFGIPMDHDLGRLNAFPAVLGNVKFGQQMTPCNDLTVHNRSDTQLHLRSPRSSIYMNSEFQNMNCMELPIGSGENVKRLLGVFLRRNRRNPVLVEEFGMHSEFLINDLMHRLERCDVPEQLFGVKFISAQFSFSSLLTASKDDIGLKFSELNKVVEGFMRGGAIIHIGDLQWLLESASCSVQYAVSEMEQIISRHGGSGRLWLIGTATRQTYLRWQVQNPSFEAHWGLQPVPIAAPITSVELHPRNKNQEASSVVVDTSLTLTPSCPALITPLMISRLNDSGGLEMVNCCPKCLVKYEQELVCLHGQEKFVQSESPESCSTSLETSSKETDSEKSSKALDSAHSVLPAWLQKALPAYVASDAENTQDKEKVLPLTLKVQELRRKWNHACQTLHSCRPLSLSNILFEQWQQLSPSSSQTSGGISSDQRAVRNGICDSASNANGFLNDLHQFSITDGHANPLLLSHPSLVAFSSWKETFECSQAHPISFLEENDPIRPVNLGLVTGSSVAVNEHYPPVRTDLSLGRMNTGVLTSTSPSKCSDYWQWQSNAYKEQLQDQLSFSPSRIGHMCKALATMASELPSIGADCPVLMSENAQPNRISTKKIQQVDSDAFKRLCKGLSERVGWQMAAISDIANTIMQCRSGMGRQRGISLKGDTWLLLLGPDQIGKRKMAQALAECIFGSEENLICIRFGDLDSLNPFSISKFGLQESCFHVGSSGRRKLPLDHLAEAVKMNPFSVVLLENVDQADLATKNSLTQGMKKGRLADSNGREVSFSNLVVVMTSCIGADYVFSQNTKAWMQFTEERLATVIGTGMRLTVGSNKCQEVMFKSDSGLAIVDYSMPEDATTQLEQQYSASMNKRKVDWNAEDELQKPSLGSVHKKMNVEQAIALDLNLSVSENDAGDFGGCDNSYEIDERQECNITELNKEQVLHHAQKHMKEFCDLVDGTVVFLPFDFEALADMVIDTLNTVFLRVSQECPVEIDFKVFEQIISACWASSKKDTVVNWAAEVLDKSLSMLLTVCNLSPATLVKLMIMPDLGVAHDQRQPAALCLPIKIVVDTGVTVQEHS